jgi:hypothetical protein
VTRYGGTIEKFIGDAERAVRSAYATNGVAEARFRELGLDLDVAICQLEMAILLGGDTAEAAVARTEAEAFFKRISATALLDRLSSGVARVPIAPGSRVDTQLGRT